MNPKTHLQEANLPERFTIFPHEFDKKFSDYIDKRYLAILLVSIAVHLTVVFYFMNNPPSNVFSQAEINRMQKRFASLVLDKPIPEEQTDFTELAEAATPVEEEPLPSEPEAEQKTTPKDRSKTTQKEPSTAEARKESRTAANAQRRRTQEQIRSEVRALGLLGLLSSTSESASGKEVQDLLGQGLPNTNLDEKLSNVSGLRRAAAGETGAGQTSVRGSRNTQGGGIDDLVSSLGKSETANDVTRSGELEVREATSLIEGEEGEVVHGARDQDAVSAVVQTHNSAVQYCYQRALKRNPNLKGKIVLRFTISPQGSVKSATILSSTLNNANVERCIISRIKRWNDFGAIDPSKGDTTIRQVYTFGY